MTKKEFIEQQIDKLLDNGSDKIDLQSFSEEIKRIIKDVDNNSPEEFITIFSKEILERSYEFLNEKNEQKENLVDALSTCIYLPDSKGEYKVKFLGGKTSDGLDVNDETLFDIASITKMYTLLLTFKLEELGYLNMNQKITDLDNRFSGLEDFTIKDLVRMCGVLYTNGNVKDGADVNEANKILQTVYLKSNDRLNNTYTDLGMIVLSKVIEKIVSEKLSKQLSFDEIMSEYLFKPFGLDNTIFNPENHNLAGNGNNLGLVHDPKARILGGAVGSAGIFTNADDLAKLAREMYLMDYCNYDRMKNIVSPEHLKQMGTVIFPNSPQSNKGLAGIYQKNPDRANKWLNPLAYGDNSFTAQGFTGAVASFDPKNKIHNSYLFGSIKDGQGKKPDGFLDAFGKYQRYIVAKTLSLLVAKKYYEMQSEEMDIDQTFKI